MIFGQQQIGCRIFILISGDFMNSVPFLSIITPTYNRGHLLHQCYESLVRQTDKDFEWIIADDGSQDNTQCLVNAFDDTFFLIKYIRKENGGKHTALNAAHPFVCGKYVLILDSDDQLTEDAVSQVRQAWSRYENNPKVGIVTFLKGKSVDMPCCIVDHFETPVDIMRYRRTCFYGSDCCEVIRKELFLKYPFPVFGEERFLSECALWNQISFTHKCVYVNHVIYLFEYLAGGLTKSGRHLRISNYYGGMFISSLRMNKKNYFSQRVKYGLLYCCYGFFAGLKPVRIVSGTQNLFLVAACLLTGYAMYHLWRIKYLK